MRRNFDDLIVGSYLNALDGIEEPVGIELPQSVDLVVKETVPGIKGATASNQIKPATLETGLVVNVPPFINEGDKVRVNTETGEYLETMADDDTVLARPPRNKMEALGVQATAEQLAQR